MFIEVSRFSHQSQGILCHCWVTHTQIESELFLLERPEVGSTLSTQKMCQDDWTSNKMPPWFGWHSSDSTHAPLFWFNKRYPQIGEVHG